MLFGDSFVKEAKEREEQLRCLYRASGRGRQQDFLHGRPQTIRRGVACTNLRLVEGDASSHIRHSSQQDFKEKKIISQRETFAKNKAGLVCIHFRYGTHCLP